jgi:hypothetical protein
MLAHALENGAIVDCVPQPVDSRNRILKSLAGKVADDRRCLAPRTGNLLHNVVDGVVVAFNSAVVDVLADEKHFGLDGGELVVMFPAMFVDCCAYL